MKKLLFVLIALTGSSSFCLAQSFGNVTNESYVEAKRMLEKRVYFDHRITLYCGAEFDKKKRIRLPKGFSTPSSKKRAGRVEWEHVVPAENFGREFIEWKFGSFECRDANKSFRGRSCAERSSRDFRLMHADMYNLFPSIGAVNQIRSNYPYTEFPDGVRSTFGACRMKIQHKKAEPPKAARGEISRAALYMQWAYPERVRLGKKQSELMQRWNEQYPVSAWECRRAKRIEALQRNENPFVKEPCKKNGLW